MCCCAGASFPCTKGLATNFPVHLNLLWMRSSPLPSPPRFPRVMRLQAWCWTCRLLEPFVVLVPVVLPFGAFGRVCVPRAIAYWFIVVRLAGLDFSHMAQMHSYRNKSSKLRPEACKKATRYLNNCVYLEGCGRVTFFARKWNMFAFHFIPALYLWNPFLSYTFCCLCSWTSCSQKSFWKFCLSSVLFNSRKAKALPKKKKLIKCHRKSFGIMVKNALTWRRKTVILFFEVFIEAR